MKVDVFAMADGNAPCELHVSEPRLRLFDS